MIERDRPYQNLQMRQDMYLHLCDLLSLQVPQREERQASQMSCQCPEESVG